MGQLERTVEQLLEVTDGSIEPAFPMPNPIASQYIKTCKFRRYRNDGRSWRHPLPPDYLSVPPALMRILNEQIAQDAELEAVYIIVIMHY